MYTQWKNIRQIEKNSQEKIWIKISKKFLQYSHQRTFQFTNASSNMKIKFVTPLQGTIMKRAQTIALLWFTNENHIYVYLNIPIYLNSRHPNTHLYWYAVRYIHEHLHSIKYNPAASTVFSFRLATDFSSTAFYGWNKVKTNAENFIPEEYCSY